MTLYISRSLSSSHSISTRMIEAKSKGHVHSKLQFSDHTLLSIKRQFKSWSADDKAEFWRSLATLLNSEIKIHECLNIASESFAKSSLRVFAHSLYELLHSGLSFSQCCKEFPSFFSPIDAALIEVAERTGSLPNVANDLFKMAQATQKMREHLLSACIYPCVLLIFVSGVFVFFSNLMSSHEFSQALPLTEKQSFSPSFLKVWLSTLGGLAIGIFALVRLGQIRTSITALLIRIRVFPQNLSILSYKHWLYGMSLLLTHNVTLVDSLKLASVLLKRQKSREIYENIQAGQSFSTAIRQCFPDFPGLFLGQILVAEKSGKIPSTFRALASQAQDHSILIQERLKEWVQPLGILIVGSLLCALIMDIIAPLYSFILELE